MMRWQELKADPALWQTFFLREKVIKAIRSFFDKKNFHEVETPTLIRHPAAESYLEIFQTLLLDRNRKETPVYLSTSPELALKKLLVAGIGNCYALTKSFRNTEIGDVLHHPEFTILEWYRVGATYMDIMDDCQQFIIHLATTIQSPILNFHYQNMSIDLTLPWSRLSVKDAFKTWAHIDLNEFFDMERAREISKQKGYNINSKNTWEELYNQIFLNEVEPHLGKNKPVFLCDFPSAMAALAKKSDRDPRYAQRFELYIGGLELGDCYTELTDWKEQKNRFKKELKEIARLGKTQYDYDHDFIGALQAGLPACSGIALGVDRLVMFLGDAPSIQDVLPFPLSS